MIRYCSDISGAFIVCPMGSSDTLSLVGDIAVPTGQTSPSVWRVEPLAPGPAAGR